MINPKKTRFLAPSWDIPPSAIRLGNIVADPTAPRQPLIIAATLTAAPAPPTGATVPSKSPPSSVTLSYITPNSPFVSRVHDCLETDRNGQQNIPRYSDASELRQRRPLRSGKLESTSCIACISTIAHFSGDCETEGYDMGDGDDGDDGDRNGIGEPGPFPGPPEMFNFNNDGSGFVNYDIGNA